MVKWVKISEIADVGTGSGNRQDENENGKYPFYVRSQIVLRNDNYEFDEEAIVIPGEGGIGDIFHYVVGKYALHQRAYRIHITSSNVLTKYVYYYFTIFFKLYILGKSLNAAVSSIRKPMLLDFEIPLPSLSEQQRIVGVLDKFEGMVENVEKELLLRQKQYEFYREKIFGILLENCKMGKLGDLGEVRMCKRIMKSQTDTTGEIPFYKIGTFGKEPDSFISRDLFELYKSKYSYPKKGDVLISAAGTIGRSVVFDGQPSYFQDSNIVWIDNDESKVMNIFLKYYYQIAPWKIDDGGVVSRLYNENLKATPLPLPSLSKQQEIVDKLDKFEEMISTLKEELELRKKQYEYYREKLLTFE